MVWRMNLDRFDGYPDSGDKKKRPLTVLEMWQELGYDPAEETGVDRVGQMDCLYAADAIPSLRVTVPYIL